MKRSQRIPHYVWGLIIGILIASVYLKVRQGMFGGRRPELTKMDDQKTRAGVPWTISVELEKQFNWDDAYESKIALYEVADDGFVTLKEVGPEEVRKGKIAWPALMDGKRYQMLTQFFFCEKEQKEKCRIQGFAVNIFPDKKSELLKLHFLVGPRT